MIRYILLVLFSLFVSAQATQFSDPFKSIEYLKLDNGMQVYLLPDSNASQVEVKVEVGVGYDNETKKNYGISHLVEHIVFRDSRVPHRDYLDYIKDNGGTNINGRTQRYKTIFYATIPPKRAEWLVKSFATMLLDKNITTQDLDIEKKALQIEIGEPNIVLHWLYQLTLFIKNTTPPVEDVYRDWFNIPDTKDLPSPYYAQINNKKFTLEDVMNRYNRYYYPANMKLFVVGNFDIDSMKRVIESSFGKSHRRGTLKIKEPKFKPHLESKPYIAYRLGGVKNIAWVGTMFEMKSYKEYLILDAYSDYLAQRLQERLRNDNGHTYSVNSFSLNNGYAEIIGVSFDGSHESFDNNIKIANSMIDSDRKDMNDTLIDKALSQYEKSNYLSFEHSVDELMNMLNLVKHINEYFHTSSMTPYQMFKSITHQEFRDTVSKTFIPEHRYLNIVRDYLLFPMDIVVYSISGLVIFILSIIFYSKWLLRTKGILLTQRDIRFTRRVSSRFTTVVIITISFILAIYIYNWGEYLFGKLLFDDPYWIYRVDGILGFILLWISLFLQILIFILIYRFLWRYYSKLIVTDDKLIAIGSRVLVIDKSDIKDIEVVPSSQREWSKTIGFAWRFYKPLVKITLKDSTVYYIRALNAEELKEDLIKV